MFQSRIMPDPASRLDSCPLRAADVARGVGRLFARNDIWCMSEVPIRNGRRADLMSVGAPDVRARGRCPRQRFGQRGVFVDLAGDVIDQRILTG